VATVRIIGPGRAGSALALALAAAGWEVESPYRRGDDLATAAIGVDLLVIATPDAAVAGVAAEITPTPGAVVAHLAGSLGLDVLEPHPHRASLHPLVSIPRPDIGARRLADGAWFAVAASSPGAERVVAQVIGDLNAQVVEVPDEHRAGYHAAACIASNHVVALLAQVERIAATAGVPLAAYLDLVRGTVDNVEMMGTDRALTGPAARGDDATIARHLGAIAPDERAAYEAMVTEARRVAGQNGHDGQRSANGA
jgi:predicted short-subunit dehydrogenase-like oxidoreductase (DUF2520 family)